MARKKKDPTPGFPDLEAHRHQDTRKNIPTEELRDFVADDEAQWSTLYSTKSYPFEPPSSGKIAVKVINHYGDEVLKVYKV